MTTSRARAALFGLLLSQVVTTTACFEPPQVVESLPGWALPKAYFDSGNEWWMTRTVLSAPYATVQTFVGDGDIAETIRWKIEENYLYALRKEPLITGAEGEEAFAGLDEYEDPVAVYPILWHFDVVGGQMIERPNTDWHERAWIRVDWGNNLVTAYRFDVMLAEREAPAHWVSDPSDPDHPIFSESYIDFTASALFTPTIATDPFELKPVACPSFTGADYIDCNPVNITYRTAFWKKPDDHQYEPLSADDPERNPRIGAGGLFVTTLLEIGEDYGIADEHRKTLFSRFNIWKRSFDDEGAPLPYREREVAPIVFYLSPEYPELLYDVTQRAVEQWDEAFRSMVAELRAWECVDEGGTLEACLDEVDTPADVVVLCLHNPVRDGDDERCGKPGTEVRLGDARYNLVQWVTNGTGAQPIAAAWWSPEMHTSEIYNAHIQISAGALEETAVYLKDSILLAAGRGLPRSSLGDEDFVEDLSRWREEMSRPRAGRHDVPMRPPSVLSRQGSSESPFAGRELLAGRSEPVPPLVVDNRQALEPLYDTEHERSLMHLSDLIVHGLTPTPDTDLAEHVAYSPLRRRYSALGDGYSRWSAFRGQRCADMSLPVSLDVTYLAELYGEEEEERITDVMREELLYTVVMHELGHAFGIRHNFMGSYDALNFPKEYWDARRQDCGPRYNCSGGPYTEAELDARIHDYAYSSVMDYMPRTLATPTGLGRYDVAALKALYGKLVEVFEDTSLSEDPEAVALARVLDNSLLPYHPIVVTPDDSHPLGTSLSGAHYSRYPEIFGDLDRRLFVPARHLDPDSGGRVDTMGHLRVPYLSCDDRILDLFPHCRQFDHGADPYEIITHVDDYYRYYYPLMSFRRGRMDWRPDEITAAYRSRMFHHVEVWHDYYGVFLFDFANRPEVWSDDDLLAPLARAADVGFQFLAEVLLTPELGPHLTTTWHDGAPAYTPIFIPNSFPAGADRSGEIEVLIPDGRRYRSLFGDDGAGGFRIDNLGSFVEKELALEILLITDFWTFPGQDTWADSEVWRINFFHSYPEQLLDLMGAIIADDWGPVAPRWDEGRVVHRDYTDVESTAAGTPIHPGVGFNLRLRALTYGMYLVYDDFGDRTFLEQTRIFRPGTDEEVPSSTRTAVDWTDPETGVLYRAYSYPSGSGRELGVGARVLLRAADLGSRLGTFTPGSEDDRQLRLALERQRTIIDVIRALTAALDETHFTP